METKQSGYTFYLRTSFLLFLLAEQQTYLMPKMGQLRPLFVYYCSFQKHFTKNRWIKEDNILKVFLWQLLFMKDHMVFHT